MTVGDVANYLQVPRITIYRMIRKGDLPASKIGRVFRIDRYELKCLIRDGEILAPRQRSK